MKDLWVFVYNTCARSILKPREFLNVNRFHISISLFQALGIRLDMLAYVCINCLLVDGSRIVVVFAEI